MNDIWHMICGGCFGNYPPSFYYKHTPEGAGRIKQEEIAKCKLMLEEYCEENGLKKPDWSKGSGGMYHAGKENMCDC